LLEAFHATLVQNLVISSKPANLAVRLLWLKMSLKNTHQHCQGRDEHETQLKMQPAITIGTSSGADLSISGSNISPEHVEIKTGQGRTTCTALVGDADDLSGDTFTWLNGNQLRTGGHSYLALH
jgi:hypothetical protein